MAYGVLITKKTGKQ